MDKGRIMFYSLLMNVLVVLAVIFIWANYFYSEWKNSQIIYERQIIMPIQKEMPKPPREVTI